MHIRLHSGHAPLHSGAQNFQIHPGLKAASGKHVQKLGIIFEPVGQLPQPVAIPLRESIGVRARRIFDSLRQKMPITVARANRQW
ncbi:hypothetical protein N1030_11065 [Desulfovibrio mangrovi]|uniref:hypothetical protein n=1 Tax=Desulfovibrio mangrovi TaxID=2976983 RepID=UPI002247007E|nr:hypothetical protein [Desulfovibrio mangrovi]UZP66164.1 hypothetical protein N1030_11065 [Desulfovibrio mangrovi]